MGRNWHLYLKLTICFFWGVKVFDGHGGNGASHFVRDHLPRIIVEDANFPLELEKVVTRSFLETDTAFAESCSIERSLSSGTTALTAMICGRLVAHILFASFSYMCFTFILVLVQLDT